MGSSPRQQEGEDGMKYSDSGRGLRDASVHAYRSLDFGVGGRIQEGRESEARCSVRVAFPEEEGPLLDTSED